MALVLVGANLPAHADAGELLKVYTEDAGGKTRLFVENLEAAPVTATFEMKLDNLKGSVDFPCTTIVPAKKTIEVCQLFRVETSQPCHYAFTHYALIGTPTAAHDDSFVYQLPYAAGTAYKVSQGYHGTFSHAGPDEYATDWKMPEGTPVRAAREGLVVKCKDDSHEGGPDRKYLGKANYVFILHGDNTLGVYFHLQAGGNAVKAGDYVKAGDLLGRSGNTGFTSGPHLHFAVTKTKNGKERESLPVKFRSANEGVTTLVMGHSYEATFLPGAIASISLPLILDHRTIVSSAR